VTGAGAQRSREATAGGDEGEEAFLDRDAADVGEHHR
jgi:hypothetical protein